MDRPPSWHYASPPDERGRQLVSPYNRDDDNTEDVTVVTHGVNSGGGGGGSDDRTQGLPPPPLPQARSGSVVVARCRDRSSTPLPLTPHRESSQRLTASPQREATARAVRSSSAHAPTPQRGQASATSWTAGGGGGGGGGPNPRFGSVSSLHGATPRPYSPASSSVTLDSARHAAAAALRREGLHVSALSGSAAAGSTPTTNFSRATTSQSIRMTPVDDSSGGPPSFVGGSSRTGTPLRSVHAASTPASASRPLTPHHQSTLLLSPTPLEADPAPPPASLTSPFGFLQASTPRPPHEDRSGTVHAAAAASGGGSDSSAIAGLPATNWTLVGHSQQLHYPEQHQQQHALYSSMPSQPSYHSVNPPPAYPYHHPHQSQTHWHAQPTQRQPHRDVIAPPHGQRIFSESGALDGDQTSTAEGAVGHGDGSLSTRERIELQGQDFVDERELQFRQTIIDLQNEQERVQKKVFVNWINYVLAQRTPPMRIKDLIEDLRDGTRLLALLEVLSGESLPCERGRVLRRPHFISNVNTVLRFLERRRIKLVNINSTDVVDGKPAIILGLIWTIILHFQIEQHTALFTQQQQLQQQQQHAVSSGRAASGAVASPTKEPASVAEKWKGGARKALLQWVKNAISQRFGIHVNDFGPSWRDGMAFLAIVSRLKPSTVDLDSARNWSNRQRLDTAFGIAERDLRIPKLIDAEDVDVAQPDEKSIMTYVAQFLHKYPDTLGVAQTGSGAAVSNDHELAKMSEFLTRAEDLLNKQEPDLNDQVKSFRKLKTEYRSMEEVYQALRNRVHNETSIATHWPQIDQRWKTVGNLIRAWWQRLTAGLSYETLTFLQFLDDAENRLTQPAIPADARVDDMVRIERFVADHDQFETDLRQIADWFRAAKPDQFKSSGLHADSSARLSAIESLSAERRALLQLHLLRARLLTVAGRARGVFQRWRLPLALHLHRDGAPVTPAAVACDGDSPAASLRRLVGLGHEWDAAKIQLEAYTADFAKLNLEFRAALDACTANKSINKVEAERLGREITEQWDDVQTTMRSLCVELDQLFTHFNFFSTHYDGIYNWLQRAGHVLAASEADKMEFFSNAKESVELKNRVLESSEFCQARVQQPLAGFIRTQAEDLKRLWDAISCAIGPYMLESDALKKRLNVQRKIEVLQKQVIRYEQLLGERLPYDKEAIQHHADKLRDSQKEVSELDDTCRDLARTVQGMVAELTAAEIESYSNIVRLEKDKIVIVQGRLKSRLTQIQNLLRYLEALLFEFDTVPLWLDKAEELISTYKAPQDRKSVEMLLQQHREFFAKLDDIQGTLSCKQKFLRDLVEEAGPANVNVSPVEQKLTAIQQRFTNVRGLSGQWENALVEALTRWQNLEDHTQRLANWLTHAEKLTKCGSESDQAEFFSRPYEHLYSCFVAASKDVLSTIDASHGSSLSQNITDLQKRYDTVVKHLPNPSVQSKLNQLHQKFLLHLENIRKELKEELLMNKSGQIEHNLVVERHRAFFADCGDLKLLKEILQDMDTVATNSGLHEIHPFNKDMMRISHNEFTDVLDEIKRTRELFMMSDKNYTEYLARLNKLVTWMDKVDQNVTTLLETDILSAVDYDLLRKKFVAICADVSSKEQDVKFLIQQLQKLIPSLTEERATADSKKLEFTVQRYRELVPSIELTTKVSETIHKIIVCREEIHKVSNWINDITDSKLPIDQLQRIQTQHQDKIILLEAKKSELLDEVRRVAPAANVPKALNEQVQQLQGDFALVSERAHKNVCALQERTHALAKSCEDLKREILDLLRVAEANFTSFDMYESPSELLDALRLKEEQHKQYLDKTRQLLNQLKSLNFEDSRITEEVIKIEKQTHIVFTKVEQKSSKLQNAANKALLIAEQISGADLHDTDGSVTRAKVNQIVSQVDDDFAQILPMLPKVAQCVSTAQEQFAKMREKDSAIGLAMESEVEEAESLIRELSGITLIFSKGDDARFCALKLGMISNLARERLGALATFYESQDFPDEVLNQAKKAVILWETVNQRAIGALTRMSHVPNIGKIAEAVSQASKILGSEGAVFSACVDSIIDNSKVGTRFLENDEFPTEAQQREMAQLRSRFNSSHLNEFVQPKNAGLHEMLPLMKKQTGKLISSGSKPVHDLADIITQQKVIEVELDDTNNRLQGLYAQLPKSIHLDQANEPTFEVLKKSVGKTRKGLCVLEAKVRSLQDISPEAAEPFSERNDALRESLESFETLAAKMNELSKAAGSLNVWQRDIMEQLKLFEQQLETAKPGFEFLCKIAESLSVIEAAIMTKRPEMENLEEALKVNNVKIYNSDERPMSFRAEFDNLHQTYERVHSLARRKTDHIEKLRTRYETFKQTASTLGQKMSKIASDLLQICSQDTSRSALIEIGKKLEDLKKAVPVKEVSFLETEGRDLIGQDSSNLAAIQSVLTTVSKNSDTLAADLDRSICNVEAAKLVWDECEILQDSMSNALRSTKEEVEHARNVTAVEVPEFLKKLQAGKESLVSQRSVVEQYAKKMKLLCERLDIVPGFYSASLRLTAQENVAQFSILYEQITQTLENLENLNVALQQINAAKTSIEKWYLEMTRDLDEALDQLADHKVASVLDRYAIEAKTEKVFLQNINDKISSLEPIVDISALKLQFKELQKRMNELDGPVLLLKSKVENFKNSEDRIRQKLTSQSEWLREQRDAVSSCDVDDALTARTICDAVKSRLENNEQLKLIKEEIDVIQSDQPNMDLGHLHKEIASLEKRFAGVLQQTNKTLQLIGDSLERRYQTALGDLQRWIANTEEKIQWSIDSNPAMDKFNLESKLAAVNEIAANMSTGSDKLGLLRESAEQFPDKKEEVEMLEDAYAKTLKKLTDHKDNLEKSLARWNTVEELLFDVEHWMGSIEAQVKSETVQAFDLENLDHQMSSLKFLLQNCGQKQNDFSLLESAYADLAETACGSSSGQRVEHVLHRFTTVKVSIEKAVSQLDSLIESKGIYVGYCEEVEKSFSKLKSDLAALPDGSKQGLEDRAAVLRQICSAKSDMEQPMRSLSELGELLQESLNIESRHRIRTQVRDFKTRWESLWTSIYEQLRDAESQLLSWSGFDETFCLVSGWLDQVSEKKYDYVELVPTLSEKISQLQSYKSLLQEVCLHELVVKKLDEYLINMNDPQVQNKVCSVRQRHTELKDAIDRCVCISARRVDNHQEFKRKLSELKQLTNNADVRLAQLKAIPINENTAGNCLKTASEISADKSKGDELLQRLDALASEVSNETSPEGRCGISDDLNTARSEWESLFKLCEQISCESVAVLKAVKEVDAACSELENWLVANLPKEHPLKASAQSKRDYVEKLSRLELAILDHQAEINGLKDLQKIKVEALRNAYTAGLMNIRETIQKWSQNVKHHSEFDQRANDFETWLSESEERCGGKVVNSDDFAQAKSFCEQMLDHVSQKQSELDKLTDHASLVYQLTSAEGRENIRGCLQSLSRRYNTLSEKLGTQVHNLEKSIGQIADIKQAQRRIEEWINDASNNTSLNSQLKSTLQEKRAQEQAHKLLNEDIISRRSEINNMINKTDRLDDDGTLANMLYATRDKYEKLAEQSAALLGSLKDGVEDHTELNDLMREFKDWTTAVSHQLEEHKESSGDKDHIQEKLKSIVNLKDKVEEQGRVMLNRIRQIAEKVCLRTNDNGIASIQLEIAALEDAHSQQRAIRDEAQTNLENVIKQWSCFEHNEKSVDEWLQQANVQLSQLQQQASRPEIVCSDGGSDTLRELLARTDALRSSVENYQKTMDGFADEAHALFQVSRVECVQKKVAGARDSHRTLLAAVKRLASQLAASVDQFLTFERAAAAFDQWFDGVQRAFETRPPVYAGDWQPHKLHLQSLLNQCQSQGSTLLANAQSKADTVMQDISSLSREGVRDGLKDRKNRLDELQSDIQDALRQLDIDSEALSIVEQLLDEAQATLGGASSVLHDIEASAPDSGRVRGLLHLVTLHDQNLCHLQGRLQLAKEKLHSAVHLDRVNQACENIKQMTTSLKNAGDLLEYLASLVSEFEELKGQFEGKWRPNMTDRLRAGGDVSGSKTAVTSRLDKLTTGADCQLTEGKAMIAKMVAIIDSLEKRHSLAVVSEMQAIVSRFERELEIFSSDMDTVQKRLIDQLRQWQDFEEKCDDVNTLINDWERRIKNYSLKNTLDEKIEQRDTFKMMQEEVASAADVIAKLISDSGRLEESSGELRPSMQSSTLQNRFQSILTTSQDLKNKSEKHVLDHADFHEKYSVCASGIENGRFEYDKVTALPSGNKAEVVKKADAVKKLQSQRGTLMNLLNECVQAGEQLQSGSLPAGWELAQSQIQQLQAIYASVFEGLGAMDRSLQNNLILWSQYDEGFRKLRLFIDYVSNQLCMIMVEPTLEKKRVIARQANNLVSEVDSNVHQLDELQEKLNSISNCDAHEVKSLEDATIEFRELHEKLKVATREANARVLRHETYRAKVAELSDWSGNISQRIDSSLDLNVDKVSMESNLEVLRKTEDALQEKQALLKSIKGSDLPVILEQTHPDGHAAIRDELEYLSNLLNDLAQKCLSGRKSVETTISLLTESEKQADLLRSWLQEVETELRGVALADTLENKKTLLEKVSEYETKIMEKEPDVVVALSGLRKSMCDQNERRMSRLTDFDARFHQLKSLAREQVLRWQQYVANHTRFDTNCLECSQKVDDGLGKLYSLESASGGDVLDLEASMQIIKQLVDLKDEIFAKIHALSKQCDDLMGETSPAGHAALQKSLQELQDSKGNFVAKLNLTKLAFDEEQHIWEDYLSLIRKVKDVVSHAENNLIQALRPQDSLAEKRAQWEAVKHQFYIMQQDESLVNQLKQQTANLTRDKAINIHLKEGNETEKRYYNLLDNLNKSIGTLKEIYSNHSKLKECSDELINWMRQIRANVPNYTKSLSDRLALEAAIEDLEKLLPKRKEGSEKLAAILEAKGLVLRNGCTSDDGKRLVESEVATLRNDFQGLCNELEEINLKLQQVWAELKQFRKDYEKVSEELQKTEAEVKSLKSVLQVDIIDKNQFVQTIKVCIQRLEDIKEQADDITDNAKNLLESHLESYIRSQLSVLTSRLQVANNLTKDILGRAEEALQLHKDFDEQVHQTKQSITAISTKIDSFSVQYDKRETIEQQLAALQELLRKIDDVQGQVFSVVSTSERVIRTTHQDGKQAIIGEVHKIQSDIEMLKARISDTKVAAEAALMQWDDFKSSEERMKQWIEDRKKKASRYKNRG